MTAPSSLMVAIDRRLRKWRRRDERDPDYAVAAWYGVNAVRNGLGDKVEVRAALQALADRGRVTRWVAPSGILWQAAPLDVIDVRRP